MVSPTRLSQADRERLSDAIKEGERRTSAELVLVIADQCGGYGLFAFLWPALAALLLGGIAGLAIPQLSAPRLFLIEGGIFVLLALLLHWPPILLRSVPPQVRRAHAQQLAAHQFALRVEGRTQTRRGVLLFVAPTERQVFILPDSGVAAVIDATAWRAILDRLVAGRPARFPVEALVGAVADILALLERHFPRDGASASALPDDIIELPRGSETGVAKGNEQSPRP